MAHLLLIACLLSVGNRGSCQSSEFVGVVKTGIFKVVYLQ